MEPAPGSGADQHDDADHEENEEPFDGGGTRAGTMKDGAYDRAHGGLLTWWWLGWELKLVADDVPDLLRRIEPNVGR